MTAPIVHIRADGGPSMGAGHVVRCLALAQALRHGGARPVFLSRMGQGLADMVRGAGFEVREVPARHPDPADLAWTLDRLARAGERPWLVLDGYHFDAAYMRAVRAWGAALLVVDDSGDRGPLPCDLLLNQNPHAMDLAYALEPGSRALLGPRHALLRREFPGRAGEPADPRSRRVLATFGGGAQAALSRLAVEAVARLETPVDLTVVTGMDDGATEDLRAVAAELGVTARILGRVENMAACMRSHGLALCASGGTCWELACLGLPMLVTVVADNQRPIGRALSEAGAAVLLGEAADLDAQAVADALGALLDDPDRRAAMSRTGMALVDGRGADRVARAMLPPALTVRPVAPGDSDLLLAWANDPVTRSMSFDQGVIEPEGHAAWFARLLADPGRHAFLGLDGTGAAVGLVRFEPCGQGERGCVEVGVQVAPEHRGLGYAAPLLRAGVAALAEAVGPVRVLAHVKAGNAASVRAFRGAGFSGPQEAEHKGRRCLRLVLEPKETGGAA